MEAQTKKKEGLKEEISIPENTTISISGSDIIVRGAKGELKRNFFYPGVKFEKTDNKIIFSTDSTRKKEKAVLGSFVAHLNNMLVGVTKGFKYKLKIVYSHFPITAKVVGNEVEISNYFGEKKPRCAKIYGNVKVTTSKEEITVEGINIEEVGQTMSNLEQATRVSYRDSRVFQDGFYLVSKE